MTRHVIRFAAILLAAPAAAQSGGLLPLKHGAYVEQGTPCKDPPFAFMQNYDGAGISDPHSSDCRARILSRSGNNYVLDNNCRDAGSGPASRSSERLKLRVEGPARYAVISGGTASSFRWCGPSTP